MSRPAHPPPSGDLPAPTAPRAANPGGAGADRQQRAEPPAPDGARPDSAAPTPLDPPMVPFAVGGTLLWGLLAVALLPFRHTLNDQGHGSWLWICVAGFLLGLVGLAIMLKHDANRRRRVGPRPPVQ